ncbi:MAG: prepilin-type N-terminal cleavage/methylation domain-containing protein [Longimicrobiales bacterium]|nr:prepilin-type N-terminal cleavage/methylation domain-containing protein [Longimicrobiales bacterium]
MRDNKGFTLIELLIVVVIIGILAAIAIPKFSATREKAFVSAMKSDLKNLASQQEIYYSDVYNYTTVLADLGFAESEGVTVLVGAANATGWSATATHEGTTQTCAVFYGDAAAVAPATVAGAIVCTPPAAP